MNRRTFLKTTAAAAVSAAVGPAAKLVPVAVQAQPFSVGGPMPAWMRLRGERNEVFDRTPALIAAMFTAYCEGVLTRE